MIGAISHLADNRNLEALHDTRWLSELARLSTSDSSIDLKHIATCNLIV